MDQIGIVSTAHNALFDHLALAVSSDNIPMEIPGELSPAALRPLPLDFAPAVRSFVYSNVFMEE